MAEVQTDAPVAAPLHNADHCSDCGMWLDRSWRACPTCGKRLPKAEAADRIERIAAFVAMAAGLILIISAFLTWDTTSAPKVDDNVRSGMSAGRGVLPILLGLFVMVIAATILTHRRWAGNRA